MSTLPLSFRQTLPLLAGLALFLPLGLRAQDNSSEQGNTFARKVLAEVNLVRTQPARYADYLAGCRPHYRDGLLALPGEHISRTHEGVVALDEAVRAMRHSRPLPPLTLSSGLGLAAADLAGEQARTGALGHHSSDGSSPFARMSRHGQWHEHAGEAIDYGGTTARRIVYNLIVDDGVRDRGHRLNLLAPDFRVAGVARATHPQFRQVCVIDFAADYTEAGGSNAMVMTTPDRKRWALRSRTSSLRAIPSAMSNWQR